MKKNIFRPNLIKYILATVLFCPLFYCLSHFKIHNKVIHRFEHILIKPNIEWETVKPELFNISKAELDNFSYNLSKRRTKALIIIKNGNILHEWYNGNDHYNTCYSSASLAKVIVGTLSLCLALEDKCIALEDPAWKYIPYWKNDINKSKITIRQLATHSSGLDNSRIENALLHSPDNNWMSLYWKRDNNRFSTAVKSVPVIYPPDTILKYSNPGITALAYAITKSLSFSKYNNIYSQLKERIWDKINIQISDISISYGHTFIVDNLKLYEIGGGAKFTLRAAGRIGQLLCNYGKWEDKILIDSNICVKAMSFAGRSGLAIPQGYPAPGLLGWTNYNQVFKKAPKDLFIGLGAEHQILVVIPSLKLVAVRLGDPLCGIHWDEYAAVGKEYMFWKEVENYFIDPLLNVVSTKSK